MPRRGAPDNPGDEAFRGLNRKDPSRKDENGKKRQEPFRTFQISCFRDEKMMSHSMVLIEY
jgi:hypothetical protein